MRESSTLSKSKRTLLVRGIYFTATAKPLLHNETKSVFVAQPRFASYDLSSGGVHLLSAGAISRRARN